MACWSCWPWPEQPGLRRRRWWCERRGALIDRFVGVGSVDRLVHWFNWRSISSSCRGIRNSSFSPPFPERKNEPPMNQRMINDHQIKRMRWTHAAQWSAAASSWLTRSILLPARCSRFTRLAPIMHHSRLSTVCAFFALLLPTPPATAPPPSRSPAHDGPDGGAWCGARPTAKRSFCTVDRTDT